MSRTKIVFAFDRVMHYHRDTMSRLESELAVQNVELILLSSIDKQGKMGRVAAEGKVAMRHKHFQLWEGKVGTFSVRYQIGLLSLVKQIRPDIVVSLGHSGTISEWQLMAMKRELGFRLVAWQCGYEFNPGRLKRFMLQRFVPRFDHHLAYHTNAKHYAIGHGARPDQVTVMHNTINEAAIKCLPKQQARASIEERWPTLKGRKLVLYVGAILDEKRLDVVFDALDILHRDDVLFLMVGDGPYRQKILGKYGRRTDFLSTGQIVDGVGPYFDAADVFVLPGTGGLAINEAMAHGLPVISGFADGSADDLIVDGMNGFRLRDGTPQELARRLTAILDDPNLAKQMGDKSREWITTKFAFKGFIDRIVAALAKLR